MSSPSDPVDTTCTSLALPSSMTFPSLTMGLSLILNVAADAGAASTSPVDRRNRNKKLPPCRSLASAFEGASPLERADETAVDLDFYTVPKKMQAPKTNQGLRQASAEGFAGGPGIRGAGRQVVPQV